MAERSRISIRLTPEALRGLEKVCLRFGVSMTALIEAIGQSLDENPASLSERGHDIETRARQIDQERRNRR